MPLKEKQEEVENLKNKNMNLSPEEKERFEKLSDSDQLKLMKIFQMMKDEKDAVKEVEGSERIEGFLNQPLKKKFLEIGMELIQDVIEDEPFIIDDVIDHLASELGKYYDGFEAVGRKLAGVEEEVEESIEENLVDEDDVRYFDIHFGDKYSEDFIVDYIKSGNFEAALDECPLEDKCKDFWADELAQFDSDRDDATNEIVGEPLKEHFGRFLKDYQ